MTSNQIAYWQYEEAKRYNQAQLDEQTRHNKETERLTGLQVQAQKQQAEAATKTAESNYLRAQTESMYAGTYAEASRRQADASYLTASTNAQYADSYARAAETNAYSNWLNADTNAKYAGIYATSSLINAKANQSNAAVNKGESTSRKVLNYATSVGAIVNAGSNAVRAGNDTVNTGLKTLTTLKAIAAAGVIGAASKKVVDAKYRIVSKR